MNKGDWPDDIFTQNDVENELDRDGLKHFDKGRYILAQCPTHEDANPSAQIYKDDWFVNCHATCGRYHISKAYPSLREKDRGVYTGRSQGFSSASQPTRQSNPQGKVMQRQYKTFDLFEAWKAKKLIPDDHYFKNIPIEVLNDLGWRIEPDGSYFIPYFNMSKTQIPFAQWRLFGDVRFKFLKDAKPIVYGLWNLDNPKLFVVEGTSDCAVMQYCGVPWIGLPSAASGALMTAMAGYCKENGIELVYAGDNDSAGDKLKEALEAVMPFRTRQPRQPYKDWGDMYEAEGMESVQDYCNEELFGREIEVADEPPKTDLENIQKVFPGAEQLEVVGSTESKEQSLEPTVLF